QLVRKSKLRCRNARARPPSPALTSQAWPITPRRVPARGLRCGVSLVNCSARGAPVRTSENGKVRPISVLRKGAPRCGACANDSPALWAGLSASSRENGTVALSLWKRQVVPRIVHVAGGAGGVVALSAEDPEVKPWILLRPESYSAARSRSVQHKRHAQLDTAFQRIAASLIDVARSLPPDPLLTALLIFPNVVEISCILCQRGRIAPAAK